MPKNKRLLKKKPNSVNKKSAIKENVNKMPKNNRCYKPKNKNISDVFYRVLANLPVKGEAFPYDVRADFAREWNYLEKRIEQYYIPASEVEKIIKEMELRYSEQEYGWWIPRSIIDDLKSSLRKQQEQPLAKAGENGTEAQGDE